MSKKVTNGKWVLVCYFFWPVLLALEGGDGPNTAQYSQLKGEYEALRQNVVQKKCGFETQSPEDIMKAAAENDKRSK